ncbi:hypothetical protein [Paraburkholderia youngii]|uniref:DUF7210 family protein n=1 Tax=Paraburkholderia youngii TaxID=2782701 RepID=UPI003D1FAC1B
MNAIKPLTHGGPEYDKGATFEVNEGDAKALMLSGKVKKAERSSGHAQKPATRPARKTRDVRVGDGSKPTKGRYSRRDERAADDQNEA